MESSQRPLTIVAIHRDTSVTKNLERGLHAACARCQFHTLSYQEEALAHVAVRSPDLIIVGYGGSEAAALLRALRDCGTRAMLVALLPTESHSQREQALRDGAMAVLFEDDLQPVTLRQVIESAQLESQTTALAERYRADLVAAAAALARRGRELQAFQQQLTHELRSPLAAALSFAEILLESVEPPLDDEKREFVEIIRESCERIDLCLGDMLDKARLETGKLRLECESIELEPFLTRTAATFAPDAAGRGLTLRCIQDPDLPAVWIDERRVMQVLSNLIGNALKFTPNGGQITLLAKKRADHVTITVKDTGRGIGQAAMDRLFEPHYQVEANDAGLGGLGLGLAISRELIARHGGELTVSSEVGVGSSFIFDLPVVEPAPSLA